MYVYSHLLQHKFLRKAQGMCIKFKIDGAQNVSHVRVCVLNSKFLAWLPLQSLAVAVKNF